MASASASARTNPGPPPPPSSTPSIGATSTSSSPPAPPPAPGYSAPYMIDAATTVALRSFTWAAFGGAAGAIAASIRYDPHLPPLVLGSRGMQNAFLGAFPFYAIREYVVNPVIHQTVPILSAYSPDGTKRTTDNLVSTAISGAATGGIHAKFYQRSISHNMFFFGGLFTALQLVGNVVLHAKPAPEGDVSDSSASPTAAKGQKQQSPSPVDPSDIPPQRTWVDMLKDSLPIKKIPDERYEASLAVREAELKEELKMLLQTEKELERRDQMQKDSGGS